MASIWKLNGGDIYVDTYKEGLKPSIAEHNPIASTASIYHFIFEPDEEITIEGHVVGTSHLNTIKSGIRTNVTLITDLIPGGVTVLLQQLSVDRLDIACQLIDPTLDTDSPVYKVQAQLRL
jgi:hypothetical protein